MNGLREELADIANLMNIEIGTDLGDSIGLIYDVNFAGTHVLLDKEGEVVYNHHGTPDVERILQLAGIEN